MSEAEPGHGKPGIAKAGIAKAGITWRTPLRAALRYGLPFAGVAVLLHFVVASIGGDISRLGFACGVLLILASFSARLVEGR